MIRFRPRRAPSGDAAPPLPERVRALVADALAPAHFFADPAIGLEWHHAPREEVAWEVFQGRLLDPAHGTARARFEAWNVFLIEDGTRSAEPLLSVKHDAEGGRLHVVRAIHCYAWEGYDAGDNVILTRETRKWVRELIGTIDLARFPGEDDPRDELIGLLFRAVVGTSRLPLTSVEAPLPAFSLGRLAYCYRGGMDPKASAGGPLRSYPELLDSLLGEEPSWLEKAKLLETLLHAVPESEVIEAAGRFMERWRSLGHDARDVAALVRTLFNEVSLSPYTGLVDRCLAFLSALEGRGDFQPADGADLVGHLLRQIGRHLTAYDLVVFHHRGANYPDALLLDALLRDYLGRIERRPGLFLDGPADPEPERKRKRLRRRALRQGWLLRRRYEGHPVPDAPTSQGENRRVLPPPHPRVPEEQIVQPGRRTRRLFEGDPLTGRLGGHGREVLGQSVRDLEHPEELRELGVALFLDRPLGAAKGPVEPDQTLLLSHEAFSRSIAARRLEQFAVFGGPGSAGPRPEWEVRGIPVSGVESAARPGTVSLADALKVADDFVLLRTTARALGDFLAQYEFAPLAGRFDLDWLSPERRVLVVGEWKGEVLLRVHDGELRRRLELEADLAGGYASRAGVEYPANGLRVRRFWEELATGELREHDLANEQVVARPKA